MSPLIISFVLGFGSGGCIMGGWWCFHFAKKIRELREANEIRAAAILARVKKRNAS